VIWGVDRGDVLDVLVGMAGLPVLSTGECDVDRGDDEEQDYTRV
jgi:hypothetical protein